MTAIRLPSEKETTCSQAGHENPKYRCGSRRRTPEDQAKLTKPDRLKKQLAEPASEENQRKKPTLPDRHSETPEMSDLKKPEKSLGANVF